MAPTGRLIFAYAAASLLLALSVLIGWTWDASGRRAAEREGLRPNPVLAALPPADDAIVGRVTATAECRWADRATAAENLEAFGAGRKFALVSGLLKISYGAGVVVILQGPACYEVDSVASGVLRSGKLTVTVTKDPSVFLPVLPLGVPPFSVRTPAAVVNATERPGNFGLQVERSGAVWAHLFGGKMTLEVTGRETGLVRELPLREGQVARVEESGTRRIVTCLDHAAAPGAFAQFTVLPADTLANAGRWLKEIHADPGVPLIAVGSEPEHDVAPWGGAGAASGIRERDWTSGGTASAVGAEPAAGSGVIDTCRIRFQLTDVVPATVVLRGRFAAADHITAMRLNGTVLRAERRDDGRATPQSGVFAMRSGFVEGENVWEIDVDSRTPNNSLIVRPQLSGIHLPTPAELAKPVRGDPGSERIMEVR
jgi:hypothetical protein